MDPRVAEIFKRANEIQQRYIHARLIHPNNAQAAKSLGIHRSTPDKWANRAELEEAITLLRLDTLEATRLALENELLAAVAALHRAIREKGTHSVQAARAILDRAGFPAQSSVDVTSGGERLTPISFVEIVPLAKAVSAEDDS